MIDGLIVGHHDIGLAVLDVMKSILGGYEHLSYISNTGLSTNELAEKIKSYASNTHNDGLLIFVDLYGGSCWKAAKIAKTEKTHIITGINIPMLLSFIHKRELYSLDDLFGILEKDGKRGIIGE